MQRIRIKKAPKMGDQVDYSFYDSRYHNTGMAGNTEDQVKNTMGPIPREEATIEVERGEVVVGDTNQDGFLELFTFGGKPHSQGGTPVDVPPGSFIYSNTRKLLRVHRAPEGTNPLVWPPLHPELPALVGH